MLQQWVLLVSVVIVVFSYCEQRVQAQFHPRGFGFPPRYPYSPFAPHRGLLGGRGAHRRPHLGWVLAANPNAHEDDGEKVSMSRSAGEEGYDEALQVVHSGDHVEELQDLGFEPSALIGFYNEDGTIGEWAGEGEEFVASGAEEMVGRKHRKLDCDDVFGKHKKKKRKFCRKMKAYNDEHHGGHHGHDSYGHGSYGGHKQHKHHKHGSYGRYKRQLQYLSGAGLPLQQLPLGGITTLTHAVPLAGTLRQLPVQQLAGNRPRPGRDQGSYRRYKRQLPYLSGTQELPLGLPQLAQATPLSGAVQLLPVQQITQINRPRLVRNSIVPNPDPPRQLAQVKFLDANGSEMLAPYQLQSHHHEQHPSCPGGTVANYNFFHFSCPPTVTVDGASMRNHPKRYVDTANAWSQFPHRIEKRKGVGLEEQPKVVNVERVFALEATTVEATTPEVSTTEVTTDSLKEPLREPRRRKTKPTRSNKIFQRKLIQWRLQNIRDKATSEEATLEPIVVLSSRESVEEGAPVNRLRDTRDSNVRPFSVIEMGHDADEQNRQRSRPRPYSNRGEQFLNRLFAPPALTNVNPFDPFHRDHRVPPQNLPQAPPYRTTPRRNNRRGEKLVSRFVKARQPTTSTDAPTTTTTTTTPEPTTTTTTTLRTTEATKRFPLKPNAEDATRRRTRYRLRPKKSIQDDEYEALGMNTLESDALASRKAEPTKRLRQTPRRPFRLGKIKPLKVKKPAREDAVTESLVKQGRWEEIFAIKTNENKRNHPRRSVDESDDGISQQDARWRLKRAQHFIRRQLRNWKTPDPAEAPTTTTTSTTTTVRPIEGEERRHRRPVRPAGRQGRQRTESSEVVNVGRFDVNGQFKNPTLQAASSNQEAVLSPKVQEYIANKVKEACDKCTPSNEIVRSKNNYVPRPSRADHVGTRSKNAVYCEPRERSLRTSTPSAAASFAASPLRNLFKLDLFKPWRNLITAQSSQS
ncbi:uncharacterized protein LOC120413905 [Culex pipiens pallens]|uniref:uncharacterized protein LOC120413905 n=1 Tax=Culex pipiens pallens TaxID=42434 RepID=UPI001954A7DD|nr:uncharacterized protein LOC120413905 [Culex pipiens pallens]